jgi:metallo-beta-lactamase family protein
MKIKFLGAASTVTGSKYLVTTSKHKYLVDCGLFQGLKALRQRNWQESDFLADEIDAVFVTHGHIDHTGYIPRLIKNGFSGPIYCSPGTFELAKILLPDSGHLQEEEARYANKKGYSKHNPALPFYTREEAEAALKYFQPIPFHQTEKIFDDAKITLSRAGHILGASCILLEAQNKKIIFSGDVGRYNDIIMRPPEPLPNADYLVIESTYGDRDHKDEDVLDRMAQIINDTEKKGGVIVIPSFAVGRTQHILYLVHQLKQAGRISDIKTFLDSPMAIDATDLYCEYHDEHRLSAKTCGLMCKAATLTKTTEESRAINEMPGSKIIISASGMASGGRVLHHLAHYITDPKNVIVLVGFQAAGTRGRELLEGATQIKIFGEYHVVNATIENIAGLSAHADRRELVRWLNESKLTNPKVFVTHGEQQAATAFSETLKETFHWHVDVPKDGEEYDL